MQQANAIQLEYMLDSARLFAVFANQPHAVFLDSCQPNATQGRFDIISANPQHVIDNQQPFSNSKETLLALKETIELGDTIPDHLPFTVGIIGYLSYDLGYALENIRSNVISDINIPNAILGVYTWSIIVDHQQQKTWLITTSDEQQLDILTTLNRKTANNDFQLTDRFYANTSKEQYQHAFQQIQQHLYDGDCYQVNYCQRFQAGYAGDPWQAYLALRQANPAPYAAYMNLTNGAILSLSPERFLQIQDRHVETKPIKGTRPRYNNPEQDQQSALALMHSEKDKAENLMIVDLLRNDLGKCCEAGSINVPKLFSLESFSNVHHLVSTINGKLAKQYHAFDVLQSCFPGGSITGAPKHRVMQIIDDLESYQRSVYCGAIGYCDIRERMDMNIPIRTLICCEQQLYCYAGGGIVYDSTCEAEYQETFDKVQSLLNKLEELFIEKQPVLR